jgi:hypothetical protein
MDSDTVKPSKHNTNMTEEHAYILLKNQSQSGQNALKVCVGCVCVHKFSENLGATSKYQEPEGWHEASSILRTHTHTHTFVQHSDMVGGYSKPCQAERRYSTIPIGPGRALSKDLNLLGCYAISTGKQLQSSPCTAWSWRWKHYAPPKCQ